MWKRAVLVVAVVGSMASTDCSRDKYDCECVASCGDRMDELDVNICFGVSEPGTWEEKAERQCLDVITIPPIDCDAVTCACTCRYQGTCD